METNYTCWQSYSKLPTAQNGDRVESRRKIVDEMEKRGIIGKIIDFKPREVLKKYKDQG